jgi:hypothetical protein
MERHRETADVAVQADAPFCSHTLRPSGPPCEEPTAHAACEWLASFLRLRLGRRDASTQCTLPWIAHAAHLNVRGPPPTWIVDCGSHHTSLHRFTSEPSLPSGVRCESRALRDYQRRVLGSAASTQKVSVALHRHVLPIAGAHRSAEMAGFVQLLRSELAALGDDGRGRIFLGGTAGLREWLAVDEGTGAPRPTPLSPFVFAPFLSALAEGLGPRVHIKVLGGDEEAAYEAAAVQAALGPFFARMSPLPRELAGMLSGGGMSCQLVQMKTPPPPPTTTTATSTTLPHATASTTSSKPPQPAGQPAFRRRTSSAAETLAASAAAVSAAVAAAVSAAAGGGGGGGAVGGTCGGLPKGWRPEWQTSIALPPSRYAAATPRNTAAPSLPTPFARSSHAQCPPSHAIRALFSH